jgi:hypothetical protein
MNRNKKTAKRAMGMALAAVLLLSPLSYLGTETAYAATTYYNQKTEKDNVRRISNKTLCAYPCGHEDGKHVFLYV